MPKQSAALAKPKTRARKSAQTRAAGKPKKLKLVHSIAEARRQKEVVRLPNGWTVTPPSVNGYGFCTVDIGEPIPEELYL